jgi:hypothetical protein
MTTNFINYILLAVGILTIMGVIILIFLDKLKGDDMYFNIDVKSQEIIKVIEDAEEILTELNYTADIIVKEIEEKVNNLNRIYKSVNSNIEQQSARIIAPKTVSNRIPEQQMNQALFEKHILPVVNKPITMLSLKKDVPKEEKLKSKQEVIYDLVSQGISIVDIAKKMNIGQGEVSLILSLKKEGN